MIAEAMRESVSEGKKKVLGRELQSVDIKKAENGFSVNVSYETREMRDGKEQKGFDSETFVEKDIEGLTEILKRTLGNGDMDLKNKKEEKGNEGAGGNKRDKRKEIAMAVLKKYTEDKGGEGE